MIAVMKWAGLIGSKLSALAFMVEPTLIVFVVLAAAWAIYLFSVNRGAV